MSNTCYSHLGDIVITICS